MLDLINMHPDGKNIKDAASVYIVTKNGSDYTHEGIDHVRKSIRENFNETKPLTVFTGQAINSPKLLKDRLRADTRSYVVLSTNEDIIFIPRKNNYAICENIDEKLAYDPDVTSWEILMESCKQNI